MSAPIRTTVEKTDTSLTFTRVLNAPRELVFAAFSSADAIKQWWGPGDWPVDECSMEFQPGGSWHYCLRGPDGGEHWAYSVFREIVPPDRIVYLECTSDAAGRLTNAMPPALTTVTFTESEGRTVLTSHVEYESTADCEFYANSGLLVGFDLALNQLETLMLETTLGEPS